MNWKALISDADNCVSIGRLLLWMTFFILCFFWIRTGLKIDVNVTVNLPDAPDSLITVFTSLLVYEVFKKGRDAFKYNIDLKNKIISISTSPEIEQEK